MSIIDSIDCKKLGIQIKRLTSRHSNLHDFGGFHVVLHQIFLKIKYLFPKRFAKNTVAKDPHRTAVPLEVISILLIANFFNSTFCRKWSSLAFSLT